MLRHLSRILVWEDTDDVVVFDNVPGIAIASEIQECRPQRFLRHVTTQVGLQAPPEELLVTRLPLRATRVSPPGKTMMPLASCTA